MADSVASAAAIVDCGEAHDVGIAVGHCVRLDPAYQEAREAPAHTRYGWPSRRDDGPQRSETSWPAARLRSWSKVDHQSYRETNKQLIPLLTARLCGSN
jgi:predicted dehydrogenase